MTPVLLTDALAAAAARYPDHPALAAGGEPGCAGGRQGWSYAQLWEASGAGAAALLGAGMPAGARIAVVMRKSLRSVAALLAVLRAGGVYVPLDPAAPAARLAALAHDCRPWGVFADAALTAGVRDWNPAPVWIAPSAWTRAGGAGGLAPARTADDLAYLLYTSGSTGAPKGVMLTHAHALNFINWAGEAIRLGPGDRVASHAPFHFDLSIFDLWASLSHGAEVCLLDHVSTRFPQAVASWIVARGISVWYSVPSALVQMQAQLASLSAASRLRAIIFAGEVFPAPALQAWRRALPQAEFHNWYGPTETNVCSHYRLPDVAQPLPEPLPIGRACPNFELGLFDADLRPAPPGASGFLWVRGPGILAGYWGDEARTAQVTRQLRPAGGGPAQRWYNTGDRARRGADGEFYFEGRCDSLIKCRGYRISLLEVEQALEACPGVAQAVVVAVPDAEHATGLRAFVCASAAGAETENATGLRAWLRERLPAYMIPDQILVSATLPLTSTGKLDRRRLAAAAAEAAAPEAPGPAEAKRVARPHFNQGRAEPRACQ